MINTAREAVEKAVEHLTALFPGGISEVLLEEIEQDAATGLWRVTLSYTRPVLVSPVTAEGKIANAFSEALAKRNRQYKVLEIDKESGAMRAMRMRLPPALP